MIHLESKDVSQERAEPEILGDDWRRERRMERLMEEEGAGVEAAGEFQGGCFNTENV